MDGCEGCVGCLRVDAAADDGVAQEVVFDLSLSRRFSVPHQVARAVALARDAIGVYGPERALVVGGGPAGVAAALVLHGRGARVRLYECTAQADGGLFQRLRGSPRDLDPTLYGWPQAGWDRSQTAPAGPEPLAFFAGPARFAAAAWERKFGNLSGPGLDVKMGTEVRPPGSAPPALRIPSAREAVVPPFDADDVHDLALVCIGPPREQTKFGMYEGFSFWAADDPLCHLIAARRRPSVGPARRVLISGAGDGGLQDLIQACSGGTIRDMLIGLDLSGDDLRECRAWAEVLPKHGDPIDDAAHGVAHERWAELAAALWKRNGARWARWFAANVGDRARDVRLVFARPTPGNCFPLNRMLALWLDIYAMERFGAGVLVPDTRLVEVRPADGHPCGRPAACAERPHLVNVSGAGADACAGEWHLVYIRHGVIAREPWWAAAVNPDGACVRGE